MNKNASHLIGKAFLLCLTLLLPPTLSAQDCDYAYAIPNYQTALQIPGFSPDNNRLAVFYNGSFEIWDLQKNRISASFEEAKKGWNSLCWSADSKRVFITLDEKSANPFVVLDVDKNNYFTLPNDEKHHYMGFAEADALWYCDKNELGILRFYNNGDKKEATVKKEWSITIPSDKHWQYYTPLEKRFLLFYRDPDDDMTGGTVKKGESSITPLPKDVKKAIKNAWIYNERSNDALLFKIVKKEEGLLLNKHTLQLSPVANGYLPYTNSRIQYDLTGYISIYHEANLENAVTKVKDKYSFYGFSGNKDMGGFTIEDASNDIYATDDLTKLAAVIPCNDKASRIYIYDLKNRSNPTKTVLTKSMYPVMDKFADFIKTHQDTFEQFVGKRLKEDWFDQGFELVPDVNPLSLEHSAADFPIENGYQYVAYRIGYDYLFPGFHDELPDSEQPSLLTMGAYPKGDEVWNSKTVTWTYLGVLPEQYFHTGTDTKAYVQFGVDGSSSFMKALPKDAMRVYILRRKTSSHPSNSYNFDENKQTRLTDTALTSGVSAKSDCASRNSESDDFSMLRIIRDDLEKDPEIETVVSELGSGVTTKPFWAPDFKGIVKIYAFSTSPCNELVLYNITANTFEVAKKHVDSSSNFNDKQKLSAALKKYGIYTALINIDNGGKTGTRFSATVRNASGRSTEGVSLIFVGYAK